MKHKPYNAIQAVDLLIRAGGGRLLLHDHGGFRAFWGWSSTRTETAAQICCFTCLQSTCLSDRKHLQTNNLQKKKWNQETEGCPYSNYEYTVSACVPAVECFLGGRLRDSMKTCCPLVFTMWTSLQICWKVIYLENIWFNLSVCYSYLTCLLFIMYNNNTLWFEDCVFKDSQVCAASRGPPDLIHCCLMRRWHWAGAHVTHCWPSCRSRESCRYGQAAPGACGFAHWAERRLVTGSAPPDALAR